MFSQILLAGGIVTVQLMTLMPAMGVEVLAIRLSEEHHFFCSRMPDHGFGTVSRKNINDGSNNLKGDFGYLTERGKNYLHKNLDEIV